MKNEQARILIIDDEEAIRDSCSLVLHKQGLEARTAADGIQGLKMLEKELFHAVLLDLKLPGLEGREVLTRIKKISPETPVIIITGFATIESAVDTIKRGAFDYLAKPFSPEELRVIVRKALESRKLYTRSVALQDEFDQQKQIGMVVGRSESMVKVMDIVRRVSATESTVLITGESGTGKELLATQIHDYSFRRNAPFVVVDCGALVETLFESELFGHVKGSFTGAHETKHGRFEVADGGSIFLDEISNISLNIQAKLLRAIQEREITRVGSTQPIKVDVRIIAATNENLAECVQAGKFREDLFYRLSVVPIHLPPLRERSEDIPDLLEHFTRKYNKKAKKNIQDISPDARKALLEYGWPGNIRELENTIERAVVLSEGDRIGLNGLLYHGIGSNLSFLQPPGGRFKSLEEVDQEYIRIVLQANHGNRSRTAQILGIDRKTLLAKIKKYNLA
ncbi:sigma-54-dependent transcriptional regulator [Acidobacteriota bacterium]